MNFESICFKEYADSVKSTHFMLIRKTMRNPMVILVMPRLEFLIAKNCLEVQNHRFSMVFSVCRARTIISYRIVRGSKEKGRDMGQQEGGGRINSKNCNV